ncbi:MAG: FHA domain-containing protein [Pyrinomonadaceae bacterium]
MEITLTYPTPDGSETIPLEGERTTFGRGSEAGHRFDDGGLSRIHATIYREGDNVWVVDENSTNGTFVNGEPTRPSGTPLTNGDTVKIGNTTTLKVRFAEIENDQDPPILASEAARSVSAAPTSSTGSFNFVPLAVIAMALFVISVSAVIIGMTVSSGGSGDRNDLVVSNTGDDEIDDDDPEEVSNSKGSSEVQPRIGVPANISLESNELDQLPSPTPFPLTSPIVPTKVYLEMTESERRQYNEAKARSVAQIIGNNSSEAIPSAAIDKIKYWTDAYARRTKVRPLGTCKFGDNLQVTYERASKNAPFIVRAFNEKGIDARIGLYLAMIESEHCVCLQSRTGPLGMFQFTKSTGELHGLHTKPGASPANPDERCEPEPSARAAASYMKALTGRYGTGPSSVPLAIGSYNSGEGGLSKNLQVALSSNEGLPRDFWTLIANGDKLSKQFKAENFKYVPKFFAAAIIGENPQDFGLSLQPISTYTK